MLAIIGLICIASGWLMMRSAMQRKSITQYWESLR